MRGYVLSQVGLEKVENFISVENKLSRRQISLETCLDRATITKALQGEKPVNLRTIRTLFLSLGIPLEKVDYCRVSSINRKTMGQNRKDYEMLVRAAAKLEEAAEKEHDETQKQELLDQAQELRVRADNLPDDDD
jgi:transcriptional regulator with XRE-family HTH domain